ncbi:TPA: ATP-grasp fold amidoligase family protein [Citrobacter freundii]
MKILKRLFRKHAPWYIKDRYDYYKIFGRFPKLSRPETMNEKVLYRKRHACQTDADRYALFADKFRVRKYVAEKIGEQYLIPLYESFTRQELPLLKEKLREHSHYVLKPNHGAGMVKLVETISSEQELDELVATAKSWMNTDFVALTGETHYGHIERVLLLEQRIGGTDEVLVDYKIHLFRNAFGGFYYVLQIIDDRFTHDLCSTFYVDNLDSVYEGPHILSDIEKDKVAEAIELSKLVLDDLDYARIDWYIHRGKIYFGEITMTPAGGMGTGYGDELDAIMGKAWDLSLAPR